MATIIDPARIYEYKDSGVSPVLTAPYEAGTATNTQLVAAVTGKRIRVMGWLCQSTTATQAYFYLKSNSAGTLLTTRITAPASTLPPVILPIANSGYYETSTGHGLFIDNTNALALEVYYTVYTP